MENNNIIIVCMIIIAATSVVSAIACILAFFYNREENLCAKENTEINKMHFNKLVDNTKVAENTNELIQHFTYMQTEMQSQVNTLSSDLAKVTKQLDNVQKFVKIPSETKNKKVKNNETKRSNNKNADAVS